MAGRQRMDRAPADSLEPALARVLQVGTYASMALIAIGVVLMLATGTSALAGGPPLVVGRIVPDIVAGKAEGFLWLGILGMVATPLLRVIGALVGFWRRGERRMVLVGFLVLVVVAIGVIVGLLAG
jgi:uncharacterized membrane protein